MPFEKGNKLSPGRPPMEIEQAQLEKMRSILDKDLEIVKHIQDQEDISEKEERKLYILQARINKYMDKLHVSKTSTDITTKGESIIITPEVLAIAKKYEEELRKTL